MRSAICDRALLSSFRFTKFGSSILLAKAELIFESKFVLGVSSSFFGAGSYACFNDFSKEKILAFI
jgi:hypothetical protein